MSTIFVVSEKGEPVETMNEAYSAAMKCKYSRDVNCNEDGTMDVYCAKGGKWKKIFDCV